MAENINLAELARAEWEADEEKTRQKNVVLARAYYAGDQSVPLSERQEEFLGFNDSGRFCLNYCRSVVDAPAERMIVSGFKSEDETFAAWVWDVWNANRMDAAQTEVHTNALRDGEFFVFVTWDEDEERVRLIPHRRYTDPQHADGDGYGCKVRRDQSTGEVVSASKRWTEKGVNERTGKQETRQRWTQYYPDRIENYIMAADIVGAKEAGWVPLSVEPYPPGGVPIIPFSTVDDNTVLWDAVPLQDMLNKAAVDLIATADNIGFPIRLTSGFYFTTDGKAPESDGGNYVEITPGAYLHVPEGAEVQELGGADLQPLIEHLESWIVRIGQVTNTPLHRFQMTGQVKSSDTLKQEEGPLLADIRKLQARIGNSWEDVFYQARRVANEYGSAGLDEDAELSTTWAPAETRDEKQFIEMLGLKRDKLSIPVEQLWAEAGYSQDEIDAMVGSEEYQARLAQQQAAAMGVAEMERSEEG